MATKQQFGGNWTEKKLKKVGDYLSAYSTIMRKKSFKFAYIDAFAGTGYRMNQSNSSEGQDIIFDKSELKEIEQYSNGSARIALNIDPEFDKYIFLDKSRGNITELKKLIEEFPKKEKKIELNCTDANCWLIDRCNNFKWQNSRAVLFLDPYGMQVEWETIKAIANTEAIDLWYLFPLGVGINRLLKKDIDKIPRSWEKKLEMILGTDQWKKRFYKEINAITLFGESKYFIKDVDFNQMKDFILERLNTIFCGVAENPLLLCNSKNNPLYLLCFASGNPKGSKIAVNIAEDIMLKG